MITVINYLHNSIYQVYSKTELQSVHWITWLFTKVSIMRGPSQEANATDHLLYEQQLSKHDKISHSLCPKLHPFNFKSERLFLVFKEQLVQSNSLKVNKHISPPPMKISSLTRVLSSVNETTSKVRMIQFMVQWQPQQLKHA